MFKVVHIHTDPKFLRYNPAFDNSIFSNTIIYISETKEDIHELYPGYNIIDIENTRIGLNRAIEIANEADLIVVYMMDICKSYICNRVSPNIPIIWRFFGAELYGKLSTYVLSDTTKQIVGIQQSPLIHRLRNIANNIASYGFSYRKEFLRSTIRTNAIAMLYKQEYEYLSNYFTLPKYIQLSYDSKDPVNTLSDKTKTIIIGNSRNRYNNHLDIINLLKGAVHRSYSFVFPFNYGEESIYSNSVIQNAQTLPNCHILNEFIDRTEYIQLFSNSAAFVSNAYRQMAMGNIFIAIRNNTKVYLNPKNSAYHWLLDEGFAVFSIDNLLDDMEKENIILSAEESHKNAMAYHGLYNKYSANSLVSEILKLM